MYARTRVVGERYAFTARANHVSKAITPTTKTSLPTLSGRRRGRRQRSSDSPELWPRRPNAESHSSAPSQSWRSDSPTKQSTSTFKMWLSFVFALVWGCGSGRGATRPAPPHRNKTNNHHYMYSGGCLFCFGVMVRVEQRHKIQRTRRS